MHCASDISGFLLSEEVACNGKSHLSLKYLLKLNVQTECCFFSFFLPFFFSFSQGWKYFCPISYPFSSNPAVEVHKNHKNICFIVIAKRDSALLLVVTSLRDGTKSPSHDLGNFLTGDIDVLGNEISVALIFLTEIPKSFC